MKKHTEKIVKDIEAYLLGVNDWQSARQISEGIGEPSGNVLDHLTGTMYEGRNIAINYLHGTKLYAHKTVVGPDYTEPAKQPTKYSPNVGKKRGPYKKKNKTKTHPQERIIDQFVEILDENRRYKAALEGMAKIIEETLNGTNS